MSKSDQNIEKAIAKWLADYFPHAEVREYEVLSQYGKASSLVRMTVYCDGKSTVHFIVVEDSNDTMVGL